jgi:hypothetical protein
MNANENLHVIIRYCYHAKGYGGKVNQTCIMHECDNISVGKHQEEQPLGRSSVSPSC